MGGPYNFEPALKIFEQFWTVKVDKSYMKSIVDSSKKVGNHWRKWAILGPIYPKNHRSLKLWICSEDFFKLWVVKLEKRNMKVILLAFWKSSFQHPLCAFYLEVFNSCRQKLPIILWNIVWNMPRCTKLAITIIVVAKVQWWCCLACLFYFL